MLTAPKKLLIVVDADWFFLSHRLPIALKAMEEGLDVVVVTTDTGRAHEIEERGVRVIRTHLLRKSINPLRECEIIWNLYKIYKHEAPAIVHHVAVKMMMNGSVAAKLAGVKSVVNAVAGLGHYFTHPLKKLIAIPLFSPFFWIGRSIPQMHCIFQNPDDKRLFVRMGWIGKKHYTIIKGSGIDLKQFSYGEPPFTETPKVLLATRMLKDKGVYEFVKASQILKEQYQQSVEFILAGKILPINPSAISEAEISEWQAKGYIRWIGFQSNVLDILRCADIHVLPSYREGLPKSLIESCAVGRPIVTTDVPGCREVVDDHINGFLVSAKNPKELAEAILKLVIDPDLRVRMGKASREKAEKEFDIHSVVEKTLDIYWKMIDPKVIPYPSGKS